MDSARQQLLQAQHIAQLGFQTLQCERVQCCEVVSGEFERHLTEGQEQCYAVLLGYSWSLIYLQALPAGKAG